MDFGKTSITNRGLLSHGSTLALSPAQRVNLVPFAGQRYVWFSRSNRDLHTGGSISHSISPFSTGQQDDSFNYTEDVEMVARFAISPSHTGVGYLISKAWAPTYGLQINSELNPGYQFRYLNADGTGTVRSVYRPYTLTPGTIYWLRLFEHRHSGVTIQLAADTGSNTPPDWDTVDLLHSYSENVRAGRQLDYYSTHGLSIGTGRPMAGDPFDGAIFYVSVGGTIGGPPDLILDVHEDMQDPFAQSFTCTTGQTLHNHFGAHPHHLLVSSPVIRFAPTAGAAPMLGPTNIADKGEYTALVTFSDNFFTNSASYLQYLSKHSGSTGFQLRRNTGSTSGQGAVGDGSAGNFNLFPSWNKQALEVSVAALRVIEGQTVTSFINGARSVENSAASLGSTVVGTPLQIGNVGNTSFSMYVWSAVVYDRALSDREIKMLSDHLRRKALGSLA